MLSSDAYRTHRVSEVDLCVDRMRRSTLCRMRCDEHQLHAERRNRPEERNKIACLSYLAISVCGWERNDKGASLRDETDTTAVFPVDRVQK